MNDFYVLDSSALLAIIFSETGVSKAEKYLPNSIISAINLTETIAKLISKGISREEAITLT